MRTMTATLVVLTGIVTGCGGRALEVPSAVAKTDGGDIDGATAPARPPGAQQCDIVGSPCMHAESADVLALGVDLGAGVRLSIVIDRSEMAPGESPIPSSGIKLYIDADQVHRALNCSGALTWQERPGWFVSLDASCDVGQMHGYYYGTF